MAWIHQRVTRVSWSAWPFIFYQRTTMSKKKTCGCRSFKYKTTEKEHVLQTPCKSCGHRRNDHEDYLDKPVPCCAVLLKEKSGLAAMKEAIEK